MELVKPEKPDPATSFKGLDYLDVPGLSKKEYKVHFYAHKEGTFSCKVSVVFLDRLLHDPLVVRILFRFPQITYLFQASHN